MWVPDSPKTVYRFGVFELDSRSAEVRWKGHQVKLQPQPARVLALLVGRAGELVTREEIFQEIWGDTVVEESNLNFCIRQIRNALRDNAETPVFIETLPKRGYRFIHPVERVVLGAQEGEGGKEPLAGARSPARLLVPIVVVAVVIAAAALSVPRLRQWLGLSPEQSVRSLAVLPLVNLTGDPEQDYLVDGLTGAVINELGKISALRVPSWTSVMTYKGSQKALPEIARELKVDAIVEGSVMRANGRVRIDVQLIEGSSDTHLWAESYEGELGNFISLQRDVARDITRQIQVTITPQEATRLAEAGPVNPQATEAYLKGRFHWNERRNLLRSLELFEEAVASDDKFALGYAGLADAYGLLGSTPYDVLPPRQAKPKAKEAALAALSLDDSLAEAHAALARDLLFYDWNWAEAEKEFQRAIELNPGYGTARQWYAELLWLTGRMEEAQVQLQEALLRDNRSIVFHLAYGRHFYLTREYEKAAAVFEDAIEMDPSYFLGPLDLGLAYTQLGRHEEAIAAMKEAVRLYDGPLCLAGLGYAYARAGKNEDARRIRNQLVRRSQERFVPPLYVAGIHAALGEKDAAFEWLEKAYEQRVDYTLYVNLEPIFDPLRGDPRLQDLLKRLNFPVAAVQASAGSRPGS